MQTSFQRYRQALPTAGIVVAALTLTLVLTGCGDDSGTDGPRDPAPSRATQASPEAAEKEAAEATQTLSNTFQQRLETDASVTPLLSEGRQLVKDYPDYGPAHLLLGQMLMSEAKIEEAHRHLERAVQLKPDDVEMHLLAGTTAAMMKDHEAAREHYAQAVALEPTSGRARMHLAKAYMDLQRYEEARMELLRALRHDSSLDQAHAVMADLYARQNELDLALQQVRRALSLLPPESEMTRKQRERKIGYIRQRAALLRRDLQPEPALSVLRDLPKAQWYEPEVMDDFARCWSLMGQPEKAAEHYEQALEQSPTDAAAAAGAAHWYLQARQIEEAERAIDQLWRINPHHPKLADLRQKLNELTSANAS